MNSLYPVYTLKNECHDCYKCVRECPVKAIKIQNGSASVIAEKCIACGHCVKVCPSEAKRVRTDIEKVKTLMIAGKDVYVSLAPSWSGIYDFTTPVMVALLKKLGFKGVSETALGAEEVSIETAKILENSEKGLYISSACPVIVDFIRKYHSEFSKNIVQIASPALTHSQMLKKQYGKDISVVFIGPCIGKKNESDRHKDLIDVALTFEELNFWINDEFINVSEIEPKEEDIFVGGNSHEGALYPLDGGMNETIKQTGISSDVKLINISSLENFGKSLENFDEKNINGKIFIEALACSGGCINGPCSDTKKSGINIVSDVLTRVNLRKEIPKEADVVVPIEYEKKPILEQEYTYEQIISAMKRIGKHSEEDELNCGGCGYPTCRDLAKALLSGDAEPSMCVSYMRKIAMRKAAAMLRAMPFAIVMVDKDLNILEANDAFMKMFCGDMYEVFADRKDGLTGAALDRIISFSDIFRNVFNRGEDIHKEHYPIKHKLYDINVFTIEKDEIIGAVITDVTKSETDREKIAHRAREVISKNIATVQNIACLLGEHMVETELLLNSIAEDYEPDSNDDEDN